MENEHKSNVEEEPRFIVIDIDSYFQHQRTIIEKNLDRLPLQFNDFSQPFIGLNHLNVLYKESFHCITNGFYHSGIVLMSQLLEETIREIIRINTGINHQGTFERLLEFASGKGNNSPQPYLIHPVLIKKLNDILENVRNPYIHLRYPKIFKGQQTAAWKLTVPLEESKILASLEKELSDVRTGEKNAGKLNLEQVDPVTASIFKQTADEKKAFVLVWEIYPLFELLLEMYLDKSRYDKYLREYGSAMDRAYHE
jgi:hypothetical protein